MSTIRPQIVPRAFFNRAIDNGFQPELIRVATTYKDKGVEEGSSGLIKVINPNVSDFISLAVIICELPEHLKDLFESYRSLLGEVSTTLKIANYPEKIKVIKAVATGKTSYPLSPEAICSITHFLRVRARCIEFQDEWGNYWEGDLWGTGNQIDGYKSEKCMQLKKWYYKTADDLLEKIPLIDTQIMQFLHSNAN